METAKKEKKEKKQKEKSTDKLNSVAKRYGKETPPFFKKLRLAGIIIAAVGTTILAAPIGLPILATTIAGYLATAGAVVTAVSQAAIKNDDEDDAKEDQ